MKKISAIGVITLNLCNLCFGQDIHFSQFSASPSTLNPATTAVFNGMFRITGNYKDQWRSIAFPYKTLSGSYDMHIFREVISKGSIGFGISFVSDKAGDLNFGTTQVNLSLAANKSVDKNNNFSLGLQSGFAQRGVDYTNEEWDSQWDAGTSTFDESGLKETGITNSLYYGDFACGLLWNYTSNPIDAHLGVALFHLNRPNQSLYQDLEKLYSKMVFHGGTKINVKNMNVSFLPQVLVLVQGPSQEVNAGALIKYLLQEGSKYTGQIDETAVYFGGWYRFSDSFIVNFRFDYKNFSVGVSYDINISQLTAASSSRGGCEFSLMYTHPVKAMKQVRRSLM
ncbi:MAG: PorP/SprF family type IX secretion system membrane protein [Bacteroidota bacterium]